MTDQGPDAQDDQSGEHSYTEPDEADAHDEHSEHGHQHDYSEGHSHENHDHDHSHEHHQHDVASLGVAVLTISSSRSLDEDPAGDAIETAFETDGHEVVIRELLRDEYDSIQGTVQRQVDREDTDIVVTTGGTGITPDDVTVEAVRPLLDKRLPGFGELFRALSREEIGTRVVGTRATAGVAAGTVIFCLPGSENAARLGAQEVIVPEAPHLAGLARRGTEDAAPDE